tara:strand:- start:2174 stop:2449 length:276 start_codon:yes stop_codon:yes gene_type:complete
MSVPPRTPRGKRTTPWAIDAIYEWLKDNGGPRTLREILREATFKNGKWIGSSRAGVTIQQAMRWLRRDKRFVMLEKDGDVHLWDVVRGEEE